MQRRATVAILSAAALALAASVPGPADAATPSAGSVSPKTRSFDWQGASYPLGTIATALTCSLANVADLFCDTLEVQADATARFYRRNPKGGVRISIAWKGIDDDFDLYVFDGESGVELGSSAEAETTSETVFLERVSGPLDILVVPYLVTDSGYVGKARLVGGKREKPEPIRKPGRCTRRAARAMPDGPGHDHSEIDQHRFSCGARQVGFDDLRDELAAEPEVMLGEMDVENGIAAVAVAFPESGVLFFDVSKPQRPRFLSWYRGSKCEALVVDVDCGAFVDLSEDGRVAFLSVQSLTVIPGGLPDPGVRPFSTPGVEVIDIRDPRRPLMTQAYRVTSQGGVHASRSHIIRQGRGGPRAPGEYLFAVANGVGVEVARLDRSSGQPQLSFVASIPAAAGLHDLFIQEDELSGRTYLYTAAELESGFYVYDVTDPAQSRPLAEWDLTPQCSEDWYGHTIDVATVKGKRIVTIDAELFEEGSQAPEDADKGCGRVLGNGDMPGPLWIVDATRLGRLGPVRTSGEDDEPALREASKKALIATWTNPALRPAGNLRFSPHNQQIVRKKGKVLVYLSHYHGGVYLLDATKAFRGRSVRPGELGFVVPHGQPGRPDYEPTVPPVMPFFGDFGEDRPTIWDAVHFRGHVFAADARGGLYSLRFG